MPGGRPPKPALKMDELAKAILDLEAAGKKCSGENLALQVSKNRGAGDYSTPALRERVSVSARWVVRQVDALCEKHGETETTAKLGNLIRRERGRQNAVLRATGDPVSHQGAQNQPPNVAGVNRQEGAEPSGILVDAAGGRA